MNEVYKKRPSELKREWKADMKNGAAIKCCVCDMLIENEWELSVEHVVPLQAGGDNFGKNLRPSHSWCNTVKKNMPHLLARLMFKIRPDRGFWYELSLKGKLNPLYNLFSAINRTKRR